MKRFAGEHVIDADVIPLPKQNVDRGGLSKTTAMHALYRRETYATPEGKARLKKRARDDYDKNRARNMVSNARVRARKYGRPFEITVADILPLPEFCPVLGIKLDYKVVGSTSDHSPSLDRIINELGYVPGNVAIVSSRANRLKSDATAEELRKLATFYAAY